MTISQLSTSPTATIGTELTNSVTHTKSYLCSDGTTSEQTQYTGKVCRTDPDGTEHIQWEWMVTLKNGILDFDCVWFRQERKEWLDKWFGYCGTPPTELPNLPMTVDGLVL